MGGDRHRRGHPRPARPRRWAQLAALDGDLDAADSHFAAAHDAALRAGAVLVAAVVDHQAGRALGDRTRLNRAAEVWRRVGATGRLAQIEALTESPTPRQAAPADPGNRFVRDGDVWSITFDGETCALTDRKGLRDLARLLAEPGREIAAQDLMATGGTVIDAGGGPVIDDEARDAYRARLARDRRRARQGGRLRVTASGQPAWRLSRRR